MRVCRACLRRWMVIENTYVCYCAGTESYIDLVGDCWEEGE